LWNQRPCPRQALEVVQDVGVGFLNAAIVTVACPALGRRRQLALMPDHDRAVELEKRRALSSAMAGLLVRTKFESAWLAASVAFWRTQAGR